MYCHCHLDDVCKEQRLLMSKEDLKTLIFLCFKAYVMEAIIYHNQPFSYVIY